MRKFTKEIEFDCFAGGGGSSCGAKQALGRSPRVCLNHNAGAIEMHLANHPETVHLKEDVWRKKPQDVIGSHDLGLGLFSPDCRHFSTARGGAPTSARVRSLAWSVVWYAKNAPPRTFIVENVREFLTWGPMKQSLSKKGEPLYVLAPNAKLRGSRFLDEWKTRTNNRGGTKRLFEVLTHRHRKFLADKPVKLTPAMVPNPKKKGQTFRAWISALKREGYHVEWRVLDAADYGVPTHRKRLFVIGRRDGEKINWPEQTHASPKMIAERPLIFGGLNPYRAAAECIDFTLPTKSIFGRTKDLAEKTQRRIAKGLMRFVVQNPKPYIVRLGQTGSNGGHTQPTDEPLTAVTSKAEHCVVAPTLVKVNHGGQDDRSASVDAPLAGVTSKHGQALSGVTIVELAHGGGGTFDNGRASTPNQPLGTIHAGGENHAVQQTDLAPVFMVQTGYGERQGQDPRCLDIEQPLGTVVGTQKHAAVALFLSRFFGGNAPEGIGREIDKPLPTVTGIDHNAVVGVSVVGVGGRSGQTDPTGPSDPTCAITTKNDKAVVTAHVVKFRGDSSGSDANAPMPTITGGAGAERPAGAAHALGMAAVYLARFNHGEKQWHAVDAPLGVVTTQGNKFALVYAWLMKYHGTAIGNPLDEPLHTIDGTDRYALVKVFVETSPGVREPAVMINVPGIGPCLIADIHLRMLTPRELARCQGFPDSYILTGSKANQVARIGNSVPPPMIEALVRANYQPRTLPFKRRKATPKRKKKAA